MLFEGVVLSIICAVSVSNYVHCFRVLLRVRLLYYIKQEVIGDEAAKVFEGARCQ